MAETHLQRRLNGMTKKELKSICARLARNTGADGEDHAKHEYLSDILTCYQSMDAGTFCNMIGFSSVRHLRRLQDKGKRMQDVIFLPLSTVFFLTDMVNDLLSLGVAEHVGEGESEGILVDDFVFRMARIIPKQEMEILEEVEQVYELIHQYLFYWGIAEESVLIKAMGPHFPENSRDMIANMTFQLVLFRCGWNAIMRTESNGTLYLAREAMGREDVMSFPGSALWIKLPYQDPTQAELNGMGSSSFDLNEDEYRYLMEANPQLSLPPFEEICEGQNSTLEDLLQHSEELRRSCLNLDNGKWLARTGHFTDAMQAFMDSFAGDGERNMSHIRLCGDLLTTYPSWSLKGRTWQQLWKKPYLTSSSYRYIFRTHHGKNMPAFRDLCPCGSGKLFGYCHGRGN